MVSATVLAVLFVPVLYVLVDRLTRGASDDQTGKAAQ
jgi:hypothetical protein